MTDHSCVDGMLWFDVFWGCRQNRKEAFDQRKRELKALGLGQDGRPLKVNDTEKEKKSRGKVRRVRYCYRHYRAV